MLRKIAGYEFVRNLLRRLLTKKAYCNVYGHNYLVNIDKPKMGFTVAHVLYCGNCKRIFAAMNFPYTAYIIKGVNPQYGIALKRWFDEVGILESISDQLIANLQKFRSQTGKDLNINKKIKALRQ